MGTRKHLMTHPIQPRDTKRLTIALTSLISGLSALVVWQGLAVPPSPEAQIHRSLGCRSEATVLIFKLGPNGNVRWPDGAIVSIEEAILLLPAWCQKHEDPVVALLADEDIAMSQVYPLLAAAGELRVRRAIFAMPEGAVQRLLSDQGPTTFK
jgi:hypothetical protein